MIRRFFAALIRPWTHPCRCSGCSGATFTTVPFKPIESSIFGAEFTSGEVTFSTSLNFSGPVGNNGGAK